MTTTHRAVTPFAAEIQPSGLREIFDLVAGRDDVLHLELGEPDFRTPAHIVEAAISSARAGSGYTQTAGIGELREAVTERLERIHGVVFRSDQVLVTHGAVQAVAVVIAAVIGLGDEALVPDPAWPNYATAVSAHGGRAVRYPLRPENGFLPDPDEIRSLITGRTKLLVLNSPSNPTGSVMSAVEIEALVGIAQAAGLLVLSDEVYDEIVFDGRPFATATHLDPCVVGVWSCSKSYAMTGWRVGYLAADPELVRMLVPLQEAMITCVSSVGQAAALAAFTGPQDCVAQMRAAYQRRRDLVVEMLVGAGIHPVVPGGAFYLMLPLAPGADSRQAALQLVPLGVGVCPGTAFGSVAQSHLRLSLASSETTLASAVDRILAWYEKTEGGLAAAG